MSAKKFKFVSPGVFLNEIDNTQVPKTEDAVGPVIIGRAAKGPAMRPVRVESFSEFIGIFGNPVAGGTGDDVWRDGSGLLAPTYGAYAAQAYLRNAGPVNYIRLLGVEHPDKKTGGEGGWTASNAYGIFVGLSGTVVQTTASLAAIIYTSGTVDVQLSSSLKYAHHGDAALANVYASNKLNITDATSLEWLLRISGSGTGGVGTFENTAFTFNQSDDNFIRKVLNTNPTKVNASITSKTSTYWLGQSFENEIMNTTLAGANDTTAKPFAYSMPLVQGQSWKNWAHPSKNSTTGWVFSQDLSDSPANYSAENMQKLFRIEALDSGEHVQRDYKISITDISPASKDGVKTYGSFTIEVRKASDSDVAPLIVEKFSNCNLNPNSSDYIARKIGDMFQTWDGTEKRYKTHGEHPNMSSIIRIVMDAEVDSGIADPLCLPFGFYGPLVPRMMEIVSGSNWASLNPAGTLTWLTVAKKLHNTRGSSHHRVKFPVLPLRLSASDGGAVRQDSYWGVRPTRSRASNRYANDYSDYLLPLPDKMLSDGLSATTNETEHSFTFTLDDIVWSTTSKDFWHSAGSRKAKNSLTAGHNMGGTTTKGYRNLLEHASGSVARFTMPLFNGSDGVDIKESDPFNDRVLKGAAAITSYERATIDRAIDMVRDPEVIEMNLMSIPGVSVDGVTQRVIETCESRADALAVIDIQDSYIPTAQQYYARKSSRLSSGAEKVSRAFALRGLNSSYGCTYFPWIKVYDEINDRQVTCPPSVAALGVMANTENQSALWFAPAGFNRGGLTEGSAGLPVVAVTEKLTSRERDLLYDANINPIASFPAEGIVVFGQKTLQVTPSALDRINVRRLLIFVKKEVSRIASQLLFDPNVSTTWDRFTAQVTPFLEGVKVGFGLSDFKVVLDETTTTPDLVDRNIIYAKIFLKPARAVEFIAVDFIVTNTGAAFED